MSYEDVHRRSGVPFYYPLVFILNIVLIMALELLLVYQHPVPLTQQLLARELPVYENAAILRSIDKTDITWNLVQTETGEYHVVPIRRHPMFFSRCKLLDSQIVVVPGDTGEMEITTRAGISGSTVLVGREVAAKYGEEPTGEMEMRPKYYGRGNTATYAYGYYFLLGLAMSLAEAFLWHKIRG